MERFLDSKHFMYGKISIQLQGFWQRKIPPSYRVYNQIILGFCESAIFIVFLFY